MKPAEIANSACFANAVLMPTCRATVSSAPITRNASPNRERRTRQPDE